MQRRDVPQELDAHAAPRPARTMPVHDLDRARRVDPLAPIARSLLALQATAGNAAVASALRGAAMGDRVVQRQPKTPKKQPKWVTDAQAELGRQFPKDPEMAKVVIKDYGDLNPVLQGMDFTGWTQSATEIYVRDMSGLADPAEPKTKDWPAMVMAYVIHHEAIHIGQFRGAKGPPTKWQEMLKYEDDAYSADMVWLTGTEAKRLIPDRGLRKQLLDGAKLTRDSVRKVRNRKSKLTGRAREDEVYADMVKEKLIPSNADKDPRLLYKQP